MNAKKCKALRRAVRIEARERGYKFLEFRYVYKDTKKQIGWTFPPEWKKDRLSRLATVGGPWYNEALGYAKAVYARSALVQPGSFRSIYQTAKKRMKNGT